MEKQASQLTWSHHTLHARGRHHLTLQIFIIAVSFNQTVSFLSSSNVYKCGNTTRAPQTLLSL